MAQPRVVEPRVTVIEGRRVLVVERKPPLPASLATLLDMMDPLTMLPFRASGTRAVCQSEQDHRLQPFAYGKHRGLDGRTRRLRLFMCADCEAVCVRDVSLDILEGAPVARRGPARRDHVIGWYTGARRNQRVYGRL